MPESFSQELNQTWFTESLDAMIIVDQDQRKILDANKLAMEWTGLNYQDMLNTKFDNLVHWQQSLDIVQDASRGVVSRPVTPRPAILTLKSKRFMPVEGAQIPLMGTRTKKGYLIVLRDARQLRALETGNSVLMERLAEMEIENSQLREHGSASGSYFSASERDLASAAEIIQGISKYYNDLATVIIANSTLVRGSLTSTNANQPFLRSIEDSATRVGSMLQNLLASVGRASFQKRENILSALVEQAIEMVKPPGNVQVTCQIPTTLGYVVCDGDLVRRMLVQLLQNAVEALPQGGGITIDAKERSLEQKHLVEMGVAERVKEGMFIRIAITDTGVGMDEATLKQTGVAFFTTKTDPKHTGLGIALVKGVCRQHGGFLELRSKPGQGTTAAIYLPRVTMSKSTPFLS
jgi:signal transduction histidine kinase